MKYLILFDIDGTILNFKHGLAKQIFTDILENIFKLKIERLVVPDFHGMTDLQILRTIARNINFPLEELDNHLPKIWDELIDQFRIYANNENINLIESAKEFIIDLAQDKNFELALVTGNFQKNALLKLNVFELDNYFKFGAYGDDYEERNLLPNLAINRANSHYNSNYFNNKNSIVIGDTHRDIECAKVNNIKSIAFAKNEEVHQKLATYSPNLIIGNYKDKLYLKEKIIELLDEKN